MSTCQPSLGLYCHCSPGVSRARKAGRVSSSPKLLAGNSALDFRPRPPLLCRAFDITEGVLCLRRGLAGSQGPPALTCSELRSWPLGQRLGAQLVSSPH